MANRWFIRNKCCFNYLTLLSLSSTRWPPLWVTYGAQPLTHTFRCLFMILYTGSRSPMILLPRFATATLFKGALSIPSSFEEAVIHARWQADSTRLYVFSLNELMRLSMAELLGPLKNRQYILEYTTVSPAAKSSVVGAVTTNRFVTNMKWRTRYDVYTDWPIDRSTYNYYTRASRVYYHIIPLYIHTHTHIYIYIYLSIYKRIFNI